jgi:hypothetical protein
MANDDEKLRINPGYAFSQLLKAVSGAGELAAERVKQWQQVIAGLFDGTLRVGSRTPVGETPAWVTLQVVHGGFATGNFAAAGPVQPHEREKLVSVARTANATERTALNLHFLSDTGRGELETMLGDGRFRVGVPEEGALLVAVWLLRHGEGAAAARLIETITPFFDRLRFYPVPHARPLRIGNGISIQTAGDSIKSLQSKRPQKSVERMNESIRIWAPLYDRAVALFLETVEGENPSFQRSETGELVRGQTVQPIVAGGWPCRHYSEDWRARARELLDDYRRQRAQHQLCRKPEKSKENFTRLRGYLEKCVADPQSLSGRDVGMIRKILASFVARHGVPGSSRHQQTRAWQARIAARPTHATIGRLLAARLEQFPHDEGVPQVETTLQPLSSDEAASIGAASPVAIPQSLAAKALRCLEAPVAFLVERGLVTSSEALAKVLPGLTASTRAAAITDPDLRRVYASVYLAFRRRRSLLLLDLESQVKLRELPWIEAVEPWVGSDDASRAAARTTLTEGATLALQTFPHTIVPNKLVKELRALAGGAGLSLPLVDELAADIFMGAFSETFLRAARTAAHLLKGTLYERYFGLPYQRVLQLDDVEKTRFGTPSSPGFAALCAELAGTAEDGSYSVARNGTIIEQSQILTTHNLAVLFAELQLARALDLSDLARRTFSWVCRRQQLKISEWRAQLQNMKNTAYGWRQMMFYLSLVEHADVRSFLAWSAEHLSEQSLEFRVRFEPVVTGLRVVVEGEPFGTGGVHPASGGRRFLGWSVGRHWLLPRDAAQIA